MDNKKKKIIKLKNGIRGLIIPMNTELTDVTVSILLGQNHEKPHEMEVTHYMEHLMGRFTSKKYNDYKMISGELNKRGAITNASVSEYETKFYIQGFYKDIEFYLDLLGNTISNFQLEKSLVKQEKNAVMQELRNYIADHNYIFDMKIWRYMYSKYAYQYDHARHIKHIANYNTNDIYHFIKTHVLPHNTIVSVTCPNGKVDEAAKLIRKYFSFPNTNKKARIHFPLYQYNSKNLKVLYIKNNYNDDNALVRLVVDDSIKYLSKEHLSLMYLQEILFNFETGIFYKTLRDQMGLIYNIRMNLTVDMVNPMSSSYYIQTSVNYKLVPILIKTVLNIIRNMQLTDAEINSGKEKFIVKYEFQKFNNLTSYNTYYGQYLLHKIPIVEKSEIKEKFLSIKNKDIISTLNKLKRDVFKEGLIFYYSKQNMNKKIQEMNAGKIKYVSL